VSRLLRKALEAVTMTREEERSVGEGSEQAWQRIRLRLCRTGMAARWHLGKARDVLRDPALLERHVGRLKPEEATAYLAALPQLVKQTAKQNTRCARLWAEREAQPDLADSEREQERLIELFFQFQYPYPAYERIVRQEAKPFLDSVRRALAEPSLPPNQLRGMETHLRMRLQEYVDLEDANVQDIQTLDRLRAELVTGHEEFARTVAERYGAQEPDALFFARCGLHKAAESYQPSRGYRFGTYAVWWMRAAIANKRTWGLTKEALG
jgi:hypothetical protein